MKTESLFKASNIEILYNSEDKFIYANWKGYQTLEAIKAGYEQILQLIKAHSCNKVLNDNTLVQGTWHGAADWAAADCFPRMN